MTTSYRDFKEAILIIYPIIYSLCNMELLISDTQQVNISTPSQLSKYHMQYQLPTVYQSPIISEIQESELDMPITLSLMALPSDICTEIQNLIAAHKTSVPSATLIASVTSPLPFEHDPITVLKAELHTSR